jgi:hypothetical protein
LKFEIFQGTELFMSFDVLMGEYYTASAQPFQPPSFQHQAIHDLESFVWVLLYLTIILQCTPKKARDIYYTGVGFPSSTIEMKAVTKGSLWYMGWPRLVRAFEQETNSLWEMTTKLHDVVQEYRNRPITDWQESTVEMYEMFIGTLERGLLHGLEWKPRDKWPFQHGNKDEIKGGKGGKGREKGKSAVEKIKEAEFDKSKLRDQPSKNYRE